MAGEGKIHVIENHLASNDNEEDVIFDQVDFKGTRFTHHIMDFCPRFDCPASGTDFRPKNQYWDEFYLGPVRDFS